MNEITPLIDFLARGGWVMYPLLAISIFCLAVALDRSFAIIAAVRANARTRALLRDDPAKVPASGRLDVSPLARVIGTWFLHRDDAHWLRKVAHAGSREIRALERRLRWLPIFAETATLTGLFGTVLGMVDVFRSIELGAGAPDPTLMAGGIWQALITTVAGLAIAIVSILVYHYLLNRIDNIAHEFREEVELLVDAASSAPAED